MLPIELLAEPVVVPDVYVSGLSHIEDVDGNMRFTFYTTRQAAHGGNDYLVEARIIMSRQAVWAAVKYTLLQLGAECLGAACGGLKQRGLH